MFNVISTDEFKRRAKKFLKKHPDLSNKFDEVLIALEKDPFQKKLHLHPLRGNLEGLMAISLTYSYRVTLVLKISKKEITLIDIGSHDEVYS